MTEELPDDFNYTTLKDVQREQCIDSGRFLKIASHDLGLSIEAKGIYLYFFSLIKTKSDFPKASEIPKILGITSQRYYKHLKYLTDSGYLKISNDGTGKKNEYMINLKGCFDDEE